MMEPFTRSKPAISWQVLGLVWLLLSAFPTSNAFLAHPETRASSALFQTLQEAGQDIIQQAARQFGAEVSIDWKSGKITVTVEGPAILVSATDDEDLLEWEDEFEETELMASDEDDLDLDLMSESDAVDVVALARAINAALDDDGIGLQIAETHEIDVTTPGASDELQGEVMFQAYQGFDVVCEFVNRKKKDVPTEAIEGRLHARDEESTTINLKGRLKSIPNEDIHWVKLPKAKQEKKGGGGSSKKKKGGSKKKR